MTAPGSPSTRDAPLPTGTVTFAFTDIEGSTERWDRARGAMQAAVRRHDELVRAAIEHHGGYVFKTMGDAFCSVFHLPEDAVAALADAQTAIAAEDFTAVDGIRIRAAIHSGSADERDGDYFGPAVNRVSRLLSIGHGGQVLLSGVTRDLAYADLPAYTSLVDLGSHRLKDLSEPEKVWQLSVDGLDREFPPLRTLDEVPHNLPIAHTELLGRQNDLIEVKELVERHRLLTIFASGGVGKTRLAVAVGAELLASFPDGAWFVDLAPITESLLVASVVAKVLGLGQHEGLRIDEWIPQWLKRKKLLLILDNCEHVLEPVAELVMSVLSAAPNVHILVTSRQALDVSGEVVHRLASLSLPSTPADVRLQDALNYGAIALFVDRAKAVDTRFALTAETAPVVAEICRRLDGIPLAIELAAARVKILSIPNLAQRLDERFKLLTGGGRNVLPRQKSLGALIDWSYQLLAAPEQLLFERLGIFAGGFGLDAAIKVCGGDGLDEIDVLDLLTSLADKSLVVADTRGDQERFRLLESTSAYALEKLAASGMREQLSRRHAEHFLRIAQAANERYGTGSTSRWIADAEREIDNFRAVLEWSLVQRHDLALGGALAAALAHLWERGGLGVEGRFWIKLALDALDDDDSPHVTAPLWYARSRLSSASTAHEFAKRSAQLFERLGDDRFAARANSQVAFALYHMGRYDDAREISVAALEATRRFGHAWDIASSLSCFATIELARVGPELAREHHTRALAAYEALGDEAGVATVLNNLSALEFGLGHSHEALRLINETLDVRLRGKNAGNIAVFYLNKAAYCIELELYAEGRESARHAFRWARQAQIPMGIAIIIQHFAHLAAIDGDAQRATCWLGFVDAQFQALGVKREITEERGYRKLLDILRRQLNDDDLAALLAEGATWSEDRVIEDTEHLATV